MKTLYVSDLDGTLLQSNERTSDYTNQTINRLVENGMIFSYATARSWHTARKVTKGLNAKIPLITYNGAMIVDNMDGTFLAQNCFDDHAKELLHDLFKHGIYPIVYSLIDNDEKFSFIPSKCTGGMQAFVKSRNEDKRKNPVHDIKGLMQGNIFYITCIDNRSKLEPLYEKYRNLYHCVFSVNLYTQEQWMEIMPEKASKSNAALQLKKQLGCEKLVVFGDGENDIDMFQIADEAYAVSNAVEELKNIADGIIEDNNSDGVAKWLNKHIVYNIN